MCLVPPPPRLAVLVAALAAALGAATTADGRDIGEAELALARGVLQERAQSAAEPTIAGLRDGRPDDLGRAALCGWAELSGHSAPLRRFVIILTADGTGALPADPVTGGVEESWIERTDFGFLSVWRLHCPAGELVRQ